MEFSRGSALVLLGVALFVTTMAVGAVTAPDRDIGGSPETLIGMQGEWLDKGSIFLLDGHEEVWREDSADGYFEVSMLDDGTVLAAFANDGVREGCEPYDPPCARTGYRIVDPEASGGPEVVAEHGFATRRITNREVHAADATGDGGVVFVDMDRERVVLVENDTEVWQWNASSFYDAPADPTQRDWLHMNDVDTIGDGRFLVSVRNANQLLVVERGEGVVEVVNEDRDDSDDEVCTESPELTDFDGDGDVRCGDPDVINHQHNPQWLGDGAVLVADSDNDRVVELHRNETTGVWEPAWALHEAGGQRLHWPRDADRLSNGNTLVADSLNKRVVEVDPNGTAVWGAGTDRIPYEADRLPHGELAGGHDGQSTLPQLTTNDSEAIARTGSEVPVLSLAVAGLQGVSPMVPFWFGEFELGLGVLALALVVAGSGDLLWKRYRN